MSLEWSGEPLRLDMDVIIASFDSISEVNMVSDWQMRGCFVNETHDKTT